MRVERFFIVGGPAEAGVLDALTNDSQRLSLQVESAARLGEMMTARLSLITFTNIPEQNGMLVTGNLEVEGRLYPVEGFYAPQTGDGYLSSRSVVC